MTKTYSLVILAFSLSAAMSFAEEWPPVAVWVKGGTTPENGASLTADGNPATFVELGVSPPSCEPTKDLYLRLCLERRTKRLKALQASVPHILYVPYFLFGGNFPYFGTSCITDDLTDARPKNWRKGGALCLLSVFPDGAVNWFSDAGRSKMLPSYAQGSETSGIRRNLELSHHGVRVSDAKKRLFACWIDLGIPVAGRTPNRPFGDG